MKIIPVITEKSYSIAAGDKKTARKFSFHIDNNINQIIAVKELEKIYKVNVIKSNTIKVKGKNKTVRRINGRTKDKRKLIVTLKPGQVIKAFEIEEKKENTKEKKK